jgi:pimeloyl-ACP methyl ester carboxylesterase
MNRAIDQFKLAIPREELDLLHAKLGALRWPESETVQDWSQGVPLEAMRSLVDYWYRHYDWRRCEKMLNGWGQYKTELDGLRIHFLHVRSPEQRALPLIMTHGWPGSVIEFHKVIGPLTNPAAHGGSAGDAFHLILPSLPGYGFSDRPFATGWRVERIARAWIELMGRLGYDRWAAQGGDWGSAVTSFIGQLAPSGLAGIHLNVPFLIPPTDRSDLTEEEERILIDRQLYEDVFSGYAKQQSTRPQTLGYALVDSPVALAAWIYERFHDWTDHGGSPESIFTKDELLDNIMLYWLSGTGASSARLYWESLARLPFGKVEVPTGISVFPREMHRASRRWVEAAFPHLVHFGTPSRGGHFAAFEQPALFVEELRMTFASLR